MSGVFDFMNRPGMRFEDRAMNPDFCTGALMRSVMGLSTSQELIDLINLDLGSSGPLTEEAVEDLGNLRTWILSPASIDARMARLGFMSHLWGIYEQSKPDGSPWLTETEARQAFAAVGVVFTFDG